MDVRIRVMKRADIPAGMRLKDLAGWNQTEADWERFLDASPQGCFAAETAGRVVGTSTTIVYEGRFAWIGMVLVDPEFRRHGIGAALLDRALEHLDSLGVPAAKLDATPEGRPVYEPRGFVAEFEIERWVLARQPPLPAVVRDDALAALRPILNLDREVFGADRSHLLASLDRDAPELTLLREEKGKAAAYALGRHGSRADHLGPWMAGEESAAAEILDEFLRRTRRERVFVDIVKSNRFAEKLVRARGFVFSRPLTRMVRGPNGYPGRPELLCAVLGPEFG